MAKIYATKDPAMTQRERDHMALSRCIAGECVVLLENDGVLPLRQIRKIALYGIGARRTVRGGTGSGDVNTRSDVNVEQGLENAGVSVTTKSWLDRYDAKYERAKREYRDWIPVYAKEHGIEEVIATFDHPFASVSPETITPADIEGSDTDTAVYVIARSSGEGSDRSNRRGDYELHEEELSQLRQLAEAYEKLIVILNVGGVMDLSELKAVSGVNALLLMGQLGNVGGDVLADVLLGRVNPSGKLTDTWAKRYEDYPASETFSHNDGNVDDEYYTEDIYVGYRHFDSFGIEPLYPFGFGRSYTTFSIENGVVKIEGETVSLTVTVSNTGTTVGKEVVQVYCSAPEGTLHKPYQELICFEKTKLLSPGESETLKLSFSLRDMASYSEKHAAWVLEAGEYIIRAGNSSRDTVPSAVLILDETVETEKLRNLFADTHPLALRNMPSIGRPIVQDDVPRIRIHAKAILTKTAAYQRQRGEYATNRQEMLTLDDIRSGKCTLEELVAQLTVEELAELCVGTQRTGAGSVLGSASHLVPGAAGDTSSIVFESRGIRGLILADGPAGLRLQPVFKTDKDGNLLPGGMVMGDVQEGFDPKYTDENSDTYYQYCTAIPIGWSLAQSWNMSLLEEIGSMIGAEMELFGVDLWLAPALNIHRDPLCGRNFEYYSEDPLISGKAAAAITRGVQKHPGRGATIKHFAANSQEDNRYFTNSHISERALREIYLKGFEIAMKESQPMSIMTSYNLLNGVHTANHYDLIQSVARDEWGFRGVVMTDWCTSQRMPGMTGREAKYPISASTGCIFAGNDLQMPGCVENVDDIVRAVNTGKEIDGYRIALADLQQSAANVIRTVLLTTSDCAGD